MSIILVLAYEGREGYLTATKSAYQSLAEDKRHAATWSELTMVYFSLSTCPLICSTLTPLTLLLRGSSPIATYFRRIFVTTDRTRTVET